MPFTSQNWQRQLANPFASEGLAPDAAIAIDDTNKQFVANIFATVSASPKLLGRIVIPTRFTKLEGQSWQWQFGAQLLVYPGGAANYAAGIATPALNTSSNITDAPIVWSPAIDLNAFYAAAGDVAS